MYRVLISNTLISAIAYAIIGVMGIVTVGWLIGAYGLASYGVIALARLFLPMGFVGVLDLAAPENASHCVATSRATGDWNNAGAVILSLIVIVCVVSIVPCAVLFFGATILAGLLKLSAYDTALLTESLRYLAIFIPFLLIGSIAEGAIRGFERYGTARGIEVMTSLAYTIGCYLLIQEGFSYAYVIYLGISVSVLRAIFAVVAALRCFAATSIRFHQWRTHGLPHAMARTRVLAFSKVLGCTQTHLPTFLIGVFFGAVGAASYDVLTRLPRFAKSVLGLLNSAIMPFTSRLEAEEKNIGRITESGILLVAAIVVGPLFAAATFSLPLLKLWVGESLAGQWLWQAIGFLGTLCTVLLSFGFNTLFGRIHVNRAINTYAIWRLGLQYMLAFLLAHALEEKGFILAGIMAVFAIAYKEFGMIMREHAMSSLVVRRLAAMVGIGMALLLLFLPTIHHIHTLWQLALVGGIFSALHAAFVWGLVLPDYLRKKVRTYLL